MGEKLVQNTYFNFNISRFIFVTILHTLQNIYFNAQFVSDIFPIIFMHLSKKMGKDVLYGYDLPLFKIQTKLRHVKRLVLTLCVS